MEVGVKVTVGEDVRVGVAVNVGVEVGVPVGTGVYVDVRVRLGAGVLVKLGDSDGKPAPPPGLDEAVPQAESARRTAI